MQIQNILKGIRMQIQNILKGIRMQIQKILKGIRMQIQNILRAICMNAQDIFKGIRTHTQGILKGICMHTQDIPLREEIRLQIFGSPDLSVVLIDFLSAGDSISSLEYLLENLGTPVKTCLICTGTPVQTRLKLWQS